MDEMSLNLLNSFGKRGVSYGLISAIADVTDADYTSKYFVVSDFTPQFTSGKNTISINGSPYLSPNSEIYVECIDAGGHNLFIEMAKTSNVAAQEYAYKESSSYILSIHVFNDTIDGIGKLIIYGQLADGRTVKWTRNITIDKTLRNTSKVRFYQRPTLDVESILVPVLSTEVSTNLIISKQFTGSIHGLAVNPIKDTNLPSVNRRNIDVDYRIVIDSPTITNDTSDVNACNTQMIGSTVDLIVKKIQSPNSTLEIEPTEPSSSFIVSNVYNNNTIVIADPYVYTDDKNNNIVTNITSASLELIYPFVSYNDSTASYLTTTIDGVVSIVRTSYADLTYRNIRTFSGYVARHKIYRKSLLSNADFEIVSDEPLFINEILRDNLTQNKYYENMGTFYNSSHINRYWFTSSNNLRLEYTPSKFANSMFISSSTPNDLIGDDYIMVKNDSVTTNRNATYIQYDSDEFLSTSGSSYDSNFMQLRANVQYIIEVSSVIVKDELVNNAGVEFFFTSSVPETSQHNNYTTKHGIRVATIRANQSVKNQNFDNEIFFFTPKTDLYGTFVIVPYRCQAYIKHISFRVYGDDGFSPDVFTTRIPWNISVANESFEIKAELFDINHNLIYSDLRVLRNFDISGSSLIPYIPGGGGGIIPGTNDLFVSGSLIVSKSIEIQTGTLIVDSGSIVLQDGTIYIPDMTARPPVPQLSQSRLVSVRGDGINSGILAYTSIVDASHDSEHLFISTGNDSDRFDSASIITRASLATQYTSSAGRRVYWSGITKITETGGSIWT